MMMAKMANINTAPAAVSFTFLITLCFSGLRWSQSSSIEELIASALKTAAEINRIAIHSNFEISN